MSEFNHPTGTSMRASRPALVQSFSIEKLYGYRTISLESDYAATILIAKNGTGKTTLLGALDAFLRMQLPRLRDLPFSCIRARLRDVDGEIVLTHDQIIEFLQPPDTHEFLRLAARSGTEPPILFDYIARGGFAAVQHVRPSTGDAVLAAIRRSFNYNYHEAETALERAREEIFSRQPALNSVWNRVREALGDTEVVYLPTYRRVELALRDDASTDQYGRPKSPKFDVAAGSLYPGDIQFGLGDIQDRLRTLNDTIIGSSNNGYRKISANIINDLLGGSFSEQSYEITDLPSKEELSLFFERIRDGRYGRAYEPVTAPNLDKLASPLEWPEASRHFLPYFLGQLGQVIDSTKDAEEPVNTFIAVCNRYLSADEPSTELSLREAEISHVDEAKALRLNRKNLSVQVESLSTGRRILLNALSSGEKQMISLFAKLFLYPKRKIVLIDEPELSLSIDWQTKILVDVLDSPLCEQVIAITHSPFVFDNELDPYARPLIVKLDEAAEDLEADQIDLGRGFDDDAE